MDEKITLTLVDEPKFAKFQTKNRANRFMPKSPNARK